MGRLFTSLILTLTAFIVNAQPSAIAPRDYQQMLKKGINVDWWGRSEKNKYGAYSETAVKKFVQQGIKHVGFQESVFADKHLHAERADSNYSLLRQTIQGES